MEEKRFYCSSCHEELELKESYGPNGEGFVVERCMCEDEEIRTNSYDEGFSDGVREGEADGEAYGYEKGYEEGKDYACSEKFDEGYDKGYDDGLREREAKE